jgi:hypothetical protein
MRLLPLLLTLLAPAGAAAQDMLLENYASFCIYFTVKLIY